MGGGEGREQSKAADHPGRRRLDSQPSSRTGENSPYGMIGGIEETSASFEARSAPRSYPTIPAAGLAGFAKRNVVEPPSDEVPEFRDYSALIFSSFASRPYFSYSSCTNRANCARLPPTGSWSA